MQKSILNGNQRLHARQKTDLADKECLFFLSFSLDQPIHRPVLTLVVTPHALCLSD